jgi:enoyl-CoA hydratase/carnithine racemase
MNRFLTLPMPTVAGKVFQEAFYKSKCTNGVHLALSGHAFAGGAMFAFAHDYRVMRSDRGFICMNEIDLKAPLSPGMTALIRSKVNNPQVLRDMLLKGHRFPGEEGLKLGFVDEIQAGSDNVIKAAKELALKWAPKAGWAYKALKTEAFIEASRLLQNEDIGFVAQVIRKPKGAKL